MVYEDIDSLYTSNKAHYSIIMGGFNAKAGETCQMRQERSAPVTSDTEQGTAEEKPSSTLMNNTT